MAIATLKRETESNEKLISRWKKKTQQTGLIQAYRETKHFKKKLNKTKQKSRAIVREGFRAQKRKNLFYS